MHIKKLLVSIIAIIAVGVTGCDRKPKDISDLKNATPADSMMYYFGEMQAYNFWQDAQTDTTLRSDKARREFMKGVRTAMKMDEDDAAYNKGLQLGLRLAVRLREFQSRYGCEFSEEIFTAALENAIFNDTSYNIADAQKEYYKIKDRLEIDAASMELGEAKKMLLERARENDFEMVSDTLFAKDVTPTTTDEHFKEGDRVAVKVTVSTLDGKEIVTRQFPDSVTLGEGRIPLIVRYALYTMTDGQTRQFMTTPRTLFGKRYAAYKLPYDVPVIFTVKAQR